MKKLVALLVVLTFTSLACYNTYHITMEQLKSLQTSDEGKEVVDTREAVKVEVVQDTRLSVRDVDGKKYPITPFNFKITSSQLVASDRDYIFMLDQLEPEADIQLFSTWKTVGLIALGMGAVGGLIAGIIATAGTKSFTDKAKSE
jgi:hypothetical protein